MSNLLATKPPNYYIRHTYYVYLYTVHAYKIHDIHVCTEVVRYYLAPREPKGETLDDDGYIDLNLQGDPISFTKLINLYT